MGQSTRSTRADQLIGRFLTHNLIETSTMSNLQSQLLLTGAVLMAVAQAAPAVLHKGLVHPGFLLHPGLVHPGLVHPGLIHPHPVVDNNNDGVADILDLNLDGKVDGPLPLYPINEKRPAEDENNDRIPDKLDLNRDGKVDAEFKDVGLAQVAYSPYLVHAAPHVPVKPVLKPVVKPVVKH